MSALEEHFARKERIDFSQQRGEMENDSCKYLRLGHSRGDQGFARYAVL